MLTLLLSSELAPFSLSLALLLGLFGLELIFLLLGGSLLTSETAEVDVSLPEAPDLAELDLPELEGVTADLSDYELPGADSDVVAPVATTPAAPLALLGLGRAPFVIWLASFLLAFGVAGIALQLLLERLLGTMLSGGFAGLLALPVALGFARGFAAGFARLIPQSESTALSERSLGRRRGVVSQGTARRGNPAQIRVLDGHGNFHYLRAEPLEKDAEIAQGTEVLVLRNLRDGGYRVLPLS